MGAIAAPATKITTAISGMLPATAASAARDEYEPTAGAGAPAGAGRENAARERAGAPQGEKRPGRRGAAGRLRGGGHAHLDGAVDDADGGEDHDEGAHGRRAQRSAAPCGGRGPPALRPRLERDDAEQERGCGGARDQDGALAAAVNQAAEQRPADPLGHGVGAGHAPGIAAIADLLRPTDEIRERARS